MLAFQHTAAWAVLHHLTLEHAHDELSKIADERHLIQLKSAWLCVYNTPAGNIDIRA